MMRQLGLHGGGGRAVVAGVGAGMRTSRPPAARESGSSPARGEEGLGSEGVALHQSCNSCQFVPRQIQMILALAIRRRCIARSPCRYWTEATAGCRYGILWKILLPPS